MTPMETSKILNKVQAYRQSFLITKLVIDEWNRILEPYDYVDVDKKLDDFFKDGNNYGRFPEAYQLIKGLVKTEDKGKKNDYIVYCPYCNRALSMSKFTEHARRCSSVRYLYDKAKKYLNKTIDKAKLYNMQEDEFDKTYNAICKRMLDVMPECGDKKLIQEYFDHITNVDENGYYTGSIGKMVAITEEEKEMVLD